MKIVAREIDAIPGSPLGQGKEHEHENVQETIITLGDEYEYPHSEIIRVKVASGSIKIAPLSDGAGVEIHMQPNSPLAGRNVLEFSSGNVFRVLFWNPPENDE